MKEERNIITMDGQGNIFLPNDIGATAMTEWEICELFGVIAPTVRAGIKALCKSGVLSIYLIRDIDKKIKAGAVFSDFAVLFRTNTGKRIPSGMKSCFLPVLLR